jgi:hypothetical protein
MVIATDETADLVTMRAVLQTLVEAEPGAIVQISRLEGAIFADMDDLLLMRSPERAAGPLIEVAYEDGKRLVRWHGGGDDWAERLGLLEGVGASGAPGFQWLTGYTSREATDVVVCFRTDGRY